MKREAFTLLRDALHIKRFHTVRTVQNPETVGHHTAGVMSILFFLYDEPPASLVKYALFHDAHEMATGDIPATAKWNFPELAEQVRNAELIIDNHYELPSCPKAYQDVFKFADMMDLCFKCVEEISTGNLNFVPILQRGINFCIELHRDKRDVQKLPGTVELISMILGSPFFPFNEVADEYSTKH